MGQAVVDETAVHETVIGARVMDGKAACRIGAVLVLLAVSSLSVAAAEFPTRKAGLWEITTSSENHSVKMQQCTDANTDRAMQAHTGSVPRGDCAKRDVQKSGTTTTINSVCTIAGKTTTAHIVITGSFDSEYTLTMTSQHDGMPAGHTATMSAKWLGPCAADQKPGDMIMGNGMKINLLDLQKGVLPRGIPGAPPAH